MDDFVRWNSRVVSAKSCLFTLAGVPYNGITAIDYEEKIDAELVYGMNRDGSPIGDTSGKYSVTPFKVTMLKDVFSKKFLLQMAALSLVNGGVGTWGAARFPLIGQFSEFPTPPDTDVISGCRPIGAKDTVQEGISALVVEISLMAMTLTRNGLTLFDRAKMVF